MIGISRQALPLPSPFHGAEPPSPSGRACGRACVSCVRYLPGRPHLQAEWCDFVCVPGASAPSARPWPPFGLLAVFSVLAGGEEPQRGLPRPAAAAGGALVEPAVRVLCDRTGFGGKGRCKAGGLDAFFSWAGAASCGVGRGACGAQVSQDGCALCGQDGRRCGCGCAGRGAEFGCLTRRRSQTGTSYL